MLGILSPAPACSEWAAWTRLEILNSRLGWGGADVCVRLLANQVPSVMLSAYLQKAALFLKRLDGLLGGRRPRSR